ncbi:MAG: hypothetical protein ACYDAG_18295 [Chloroflexota bacterium]
MGESRAKLQAAGLETLGVVATPASRARLYYRMRPTALTLAADPELTTHRRFGVPINQLTGEYWDHVLDIYQKELPETPRTELATEIHNKWDGYQPTAEDHADGEDGVPATGQFLIGPDGVIRWLSIEGVNVAAGEFPNDDDLLGLAKNFAG